MWLKEYLNTLDRLEKIEGKYFIPSHCELSENIKDLIKLNRDKIKEILNNILEMCLTEKTFEEILKNIFDSYNLIMNTNQFVLVGSTVRSYLSYLYDEEKIKFEFKDNKMYWKTK